MPKSKKLTAVYALIMDLPLSIVVTIVALALGGNLSMERFIPSFCLAYVLTFFINFLPVRPTCKYDYCSILCSYS